MSSLLIPTIKYCYTEALSILSKKIDLTLPGPMPNVGTVRSMINKASNAEEEATVYLDLLEKSHEQWIKLLSSMTENERITDSEIQTTFLSECNYPPVMVELKILVSLIYLAVSNEAILGKLSVESLLSLNSVDSNLAASNQPSEISTLMASESANTSADPLPPSDVNTLPFAITSISSDVPAPITVAESNNNQMEIDSDQ
ncbi:hypothetical protein DdX_19406 [Ditylenchus destructor]|uniref:Uncharacterized protein n=1 Tax=Ditylenchus destructor TaxID=166010 RepID=A0AAD4QU82_9BILA|nr:hypothetical protein DdX_19406 [Ditylenchus destructor]